jgi:hypothetical protein
MSSTMCRRKGVTLPSAAEWFVMGASPELRLTLRSSGEPWRLKISRAKSTADGLATRCHAHRYLGSCAPRSGLSRSDFVL